MIDTAVPLSRHSKQNLSGKIRELWKLIRPVVVRVRYCPIKLIALQVKCVFSFHDLYLTCTVLLDATWMRSGFLLYVLNLVRPRQTVQVASQDYRGLNIDRLV